MDEVKRLIARCEAAIVAYDRCLPHAGPLQRAQLLAHRDWDSRIIADLRRFL
jgi:hypothetical protein